MTNYSPNIVCISVQELKKRLEENPHLCVIDVREIDEWNHSHIPAAIHIPKDALVATIANYVPNKNEPVYLHCQRGARSAIAAAWLGEAGYSEVYSVNGGLLDWEAQGYPLV